LIENGFPDEEETGDEAKTVPDVFEMRRKYDLSR
jgi:hypothetical protein